MQSSALPKNAKLPKPAQTAPDEWGMFDPQQAGLPAITRALNAKTQAPQAVASPVARPAEIVPAPTPSTAGAKRGAQPAEPIEFGAVYQIESPMLCPHCRNSIRTFRALRVMRTQVPFMSTLPRKGYVLVCPECAGLLSAELSGLI